MSNPDEKTALEQFGKGDKYFGVATMMATLPGLPMLGHGQVQGFGEKYGMEFRRASLDEQPDPGLVARHEREIFPLLHRRAWFAEAHDFLLYDFVTDGGGVDEHVFAYSNGSGPERSLVLYHDRFALDQRARSAIRPRTRVEGARRLEARGPALARRGARSAQRPGGVRHLPRCADRSRVPPVLPRDLGARPAPLARRVRGPRLLGVPRGPRRRRRSMGAPGRAARRAPASRRSTTRCASSSSSRSTDRSARSSPMAWSRSCDGVATAAQLDELERRFAAFLAAIAEATGVAGDPAVAGDGDPASGRAGLRRHGASAADAGSRRHRRGQGGGSRRAGEVDASRPTRRRARARSRDRATLLAWLAAQPDRARWRRAPTPPRRAGPGTTSCGSRAPWSPGSTTPASARATPGP